MPILAIVGAGPGMGLAIARTFGQNGFTVALLARNHAKLDQRVAQLADEGITAAGFSADVADRPSLVAAFAAVKERFGPLPSGAFRPVTWRSMPGLAGSPALNPSISRHSIGS
jgi:NAD(P)-dependent dehydrogenase (short-subunit alcohol dehydrogenase family)